MFTTLYLSLSFTIALDNGYFVDVYFIKIISQSSCTVNKIKLLILIPYVNKL